MLVDEVDIVLRGGHGGAGKVSFYPREKAGPDGGNGGRGGDIYIQVTSDLTALNQFTKRKIIEAERGEQGGSFCKFGKNGKDIEILMPVGTVLTDRLSGDVLELDQVEERILICKGGIGGRGNAELKSSRRTTPMHAQKGMPGQERELQVILKLIADFGLIGLPNSGKSSLLNELTAANAKIADYPFTTLEPNLGVWNPSAGSGLGSKVIADIPGLIEGAAEGKGLGIKFLKHIEKVGLLLHTVALDSEDVMGDYQAVIHELEKYNPELTQKKEIILLTKSDLAEKSQVENASKKLKKFKKEILPVSIYDFESIEDLKRILS